MTKIYLASDHAGLELKSKAFLFLSQGEGFKRLQSSLGSYTVDDLGPYSNESVDYPDYANLVCQRIRNLRLTDSDARPAEFGVLICGSGQGMAMRANKFSHIRAALCWNQEIAKLSREHNDANVLCLGGRVVDHEISLQILEIFLTQDFAGGRHTPRVGKINLPVG
jgi:ribose 5-phosphate isomerase B